jgi:flagellar motility protein MotE (MotC chaperone)
VHAIVDRRSAARADNRDADSHESVREDVTSGSVDFTTLDWLRQHHPAWRLLTSPHTPLIASFLHRVFVLPNERVIAQADLVEALEDELFALREIQGSEAFPKSALDYLNDWAGSDKGWLRKFYRQGSDEPYFDLTPATEKAIAWLVSLTARAFVGTESRLLTLFELLRQIDVGSETDPATRIAELERRRDQIDAEIARARDGDLPLLDETALKERFHQFIELSRTLLSDFREVEQNFRTLDRWVRERIMLWEGSKGELLEAIMGERDAITDSDQGRSFRGFWDFLMSSARQAEFSKLLERILALPAVAELAPDVRTRRIHYDWLEAGEHTQRTVAQLSQQLRRFLDDKAWLENRRIMDILRTIEGKALAMRQSPPRGDCMTIDAIGAVIELPMERPLYTPAARPRLTDRILDAVDVEVDTEALYATAVVDSGVLAQHIRHALLRADQVTLAELCRMRPLEHGLAELVTYLDLADRSFGAVVDESFEDRIRWYGPDRDGHERSKQVSLPRVIFVR